MIIFVNFSLLHLDRGVLLCPLFFILLYTFEALRAMFISSFGEEIDYDLYNYFGINFILFFIFAFF